MVRDDEYKLRLLDFVQNEYGFEADDITAAKRGFYAETWKLSVGNINYFIKMVYCDEHKNVYKRSFPIVRHLCDHGIDFISRIVKTKDGRLSTRFDNAVTGIFNWIEGENTETDKTKAPEYQMLAKVYNVPCDDIDIPREEFSAICADEFFMRWNTYEDKQTLQLFEKNRKKLKNRADRLNLFSKINRDNKKGFVITHGDAGGNFIAGDDRNFIVDWDGVTHAPPERDAWVMCSRDWARELFNKTLRENGISYSLQPERLAYYCYRFFFFYLNAFLIAGSQAGVIEEYIDSWIDESIRWADSL